MGTDVWEEAQVWMITPSGETLLLSRLRVWAELVDIEWDQTNSPLGLAA